ncbi:MAG: response regulator [Metallibacterium scheffleri]|jgi:PleD family two-component response regulator/EAL domain-containing protein (putative c-di-GMP-specific phosphodiesterase class I)|uniref:response regulator n=1 Tax=Metallibacterium scheffleri TaxID=993689 RepID=UPI0026F1F0E4|nr:response regulator [Metallibacterium scheffleri]MCK9368129.1 response regulator [Metallibacterium scheffleri]
MKVTEQQIRSEELKGAFLRHLPQRMKILLRRAERQRREGWDVNALYLLETEFARLAEAAGRYGLPEQAAPLQALAESLQPFVLGSTLPDAAANDAIAQALEALQAPMGQAAMLELAARAEAAPSAPPPRAETPADPAGYAQMETPPPGYWRELGIADPEPPAPALITDSAGMPLPAAAAAEIAATVPAAPAALAVAPQVLLLGADAVLHDLALHFEQDGRAVAEVDSVERMIMALGDAAPPRLLVVGARALAALPLLAPALRHARVEAGHRIALLAILEHDDLGARLEALRAGADHALPRTLGLHALLAQAEPLLKDELDDAPYRVLVVDDDAAQAAFAETVLRRAGMQTRTVVEPLATLDELERFQPDLILMDINMPGADGFELTALIREREAFVATPIVFLSGDPDTDRQFAALDAGGDDFIAKPVRPRHLIAAVGNRVRRARAATQRGPRAHGGSGALVDRGVLFDRIARQLAARTGVTPGGGLLLIELNDAPRLRERLGLGGFDRLLQQFATWVAEQTLPREVLAPFGPSAILLFAPQRGEAALAAFAEDLAARIGQERFEMARAVPLAFSAGVCGMGAGADPMALLGACERALENARLQGVNVARHAAQASGQQTLAALVRSALAEDTLSLAFQPLVPIAGMAAAPRYQALLRLRDARGSEHAAATLLPEAAAAGLLPALDVWVLKRALVVLAARRKLGTALMLFVSQSFEVFEEVWRDGSLAQALAAAALPASSLVLEYRCEALLGDYPDAARRFADLHARGLAVAVAGVSAQTLAQPGFNDLPLDFLKLAPELARDGQARAVVAAGHARGALVIAPRVHDASTAAAFYAAGADLLQGNFVQEAGAQLDYDFVSNTA